MGQLRLRFRYHEFCGPWFDLLFPTPSELGKLCQGAGWRVREIIPGFSYGAVLEREG